MHTLGPVALFYFECSSDVLSPLPLSERSQQQAVDLFSVNTCSTLVLNEIFVCFQAARVSSREAFGGT
jgi:hypothetical protein